MRSSCSKLDVGKCKDNQQQVAIISSLKEIRRVSEANQLRLRHLELAVDNITSICNRIRKDLWPLGLSMSVQGSVGEGQAEAIDMKPPFSRPSSPTKNKDDVLLGVQMQQLVEQAAASGILKEAKAKPKTYHVNLSENTKTNSKGTRSSSKNVQSTTNNIMSMRSSTTVKNNMGPTQPEGSPTTTRAGNNMKMKATTTAKVSVKSTVNKTKTTTISEVYVEQPPALEKCKEILRANVPVKSSVKNVEMFKSKGSEKLTSSPNRDDKSRNTTKSHALTVWNSQFGAPSVAKSDIKPRRKWSTCKEIVLG